MGKDKTCRLVVKQIFLPFPHLSHGDAQATKCSQAWSFIQHLFHFFGRSLTYSSFLLAYTLDFTSKMKRLKGHVEVKLSSNSFVLI